jgi:uncharacterized membrane protein YccC
MALGIGIIALLVSVVAMTYAWKLQQELGTMSRRLDRYNKALFDANDEIRRLQETLAATTAELRVEIKRNQGVAQFEPTMTIREAQLLHPQASQVLAGLHIGGCSSCGVEPEMTLSEACSEHGRDLTTVLQNLNQLLTNGSNGPTAKLPNVELVIS